MKTKTADGRTTITDKLADTDPDVRKYLDRIRAIDPNWPPRPAAPLCECGCGLDVNKCECPIARGEV